MPCAANFPRNNRHRLPLSSVFLCVKPAILLLIPFLSSAQTAEEIMTKVAENQDRAEAVRASYVYRQNILVRLQKSGGKLAREENREYTVTPGPDGIDRELVSSSTKPEEERHKNIDIDGDIANGLAEHFGGEEESKDGINQDLFPLTPKKQKGYAFKLAGSEIWHGHDVFRITFEPRPKNQLVDGDYSPSWAGEALIDKADLTPVLITTHSAQGVPMLIKTLLGTNLQNLGFRLTYEKFDNVWFPVSYSGEFKLRALFLYARTIALTLTNSGFQKADVQSAVTFEETEKR